MELFATPTPTATNTATITPTFTLTPTHVAPLELIGCAYNSCPSSKTIVDYVGENNFPEINIETPITIIWTDAVHFFYSWCAKDQATLEDNLNKLDFYFSIDAVPLTNYFTTETYEYTAPEDPSQTQSCFGIGGVAMGWKSGESHQVKIGTRTTGDLSDGWNSYPSGADYAYIFDIIPADLPTETPTPTSTLTPTATKTFAPQAPAATVPPPAPACLVNSNIRIDNRTDGPATLYLKGPSNFTFSIALGPNTVLVCAGSYDYTIYGTCNGISASGAGRISDGDDIYFYCE